MKINTQTSTPEQQSLAKRAKLNHLISSKDSRNTLNEIAKELWSLESAAERDAFVRGVGDYEGLPFLEGKPRLIPLLVLGRFYQASQLAKRVEPNPYLGPDLKPAADDIEVNTKAVIKSIYFTESDVTNTIGGIFMMATTAEKDERDHRRKNLKTFVERFLVSRFTTEGVFLSIPIPEVNELEKLIWMNW